MTSEVDGVAPDAVFAAGYTYGAIVDNATAAGRSDEFVLRIPFADLTPP